MFLSTPPSRVATKIHSVSSSDSDVSIHATLAGGDSFCNMLPLSGQCFYPRHPRGWRHPFSSYRHEDFQCFYPRHPRGWRLCILSASSLNALGFYPRHPRGWRPQNDGRKEIKQNVSIHATLAGGDHSPFLFCNQFSQVSIHATLAGGDL